MLVVGEEEEDAEDTEEGDDDVVVAEAEEGEEEEEAVVVAFLSLPKDRESDAKIGVRTASYEEPAEVARRRETARSCADWKAELDWPNTVHWSCLSQELIWLTCEARLWKLTVNLGKSTS